MHLGKPLVASVRKQELKEWILSASLANLCLLKSWTVLGSSLFLPPRPAIDHQAAVCNFLIFVLVWKLLLYLERTVTYAAALYLVRSILFVPTLLALDFIRSSLLPLSLITPYLGKTGVAFAGIATACLIAYLAWTRFDLLVRTAKTIALIVSPLVLLFPVRAMWRATKSTAAASMVAQPASSVTAVRPSPRVLWLLFDELDQRLVFTGRPAGLELPELDRFRESAIFATDAASPARDTKESIPSILIGKKIFKAEEDGTGLRLTFNPGTVPVSLNQYLKSSLFYQLKAEGFRSAVDGWYLPYCLLFGQSLTDCVRQPMYGTSVDPTDTLLERMTWQLWDLVPWAKRRQAIDKYLLILDKAKKLSIDRSQNLVYVHFPIPHAPAIYKRKTSEFVTTGFDDLDEWYLDNVTLVDHTLGEIRHVMEQAGTWDETIVLITSDHPWRGSISFDGRWDYRVPFLLKLAGQNRRIDHHEPFDTIVIHDLIPELLRKNISDPESVIRWLGLHIGPSNPASSFPSSGSSE